MNRNIECIGRLLDKNYSYDDISEWFVENKFTDDIIIRQYTRTSERAQFIYDILKENQANDNIILLYFEWTILPKESIKITCTTHKEEKVFTYGL